MAQKQPNGEQKDENLGFLAVLPESNVFELFPEINILADINGQLVTEVVHVRNLLVEPGRVLRLGQQIRHVQILQIRLVLVRREPRFNIIST